MEPTVLWDNVAKHFSTPSALGRVEVMTQAGVQTEGWWKAELIFLLEQLRRESGIQHWDREKSTGEGRQKVDLVADDVVIELKTALCGKQKGENWRLPDYVDWILEDVQKLSPLKALWTDARHFFVFVVAYPSPPSEDWGALLDKIANKDASSVVSLSHLDDVGSGSLSIGWLGVE